jgi:hypothetical protein
VAVYLGMPFDGFLLFNDPFLFKMAIVKMQATAPMIIPPIK